MIAVTSRMQTRRARLALKRALQDLDVTVLIRALRYGGADTAHWWRRRADARTLAIELEKCVSYWIGAVW